MKNPVLINRSFAVMPVLLLLLFLQNKHTKAQTDSLFFFEPDFLQAEVCQDSSIEVSTFLHNQSGEILEFEFPAFLDDTSQAAQTSNYQWISSDHPQGLEYHWIDISQTGTILPRLADDTIVGPYPIGFDFTFYGEDRQAFWINSNGTLVFDSNYISINNIQIPTNNDYVNDFIAWCWDDLDPDHPESHVYYENRQDSLIIQFDHYYEFPAGSNTMSAQLILTTNGNILMQYKSFDPGFDLEGCTVGLQSPDPSVGLPIVHNQAFLHDSLCILFFPLHAFVTSVHPSSGSLSPGDSLSISLQWLAEAPAGNTYLQYVLMKARQESRLLYNEMHVTIAGRLKGSITQAGSSKPISQVKIVADSMTVYSDDEGMYHMDLHPGSYAIHFSKEGYESVQLEDVSVEAGITSTLDLEMKKVYILGGTVFASLYQLDSGYVQTYSLEQGQLDASQESKIEVLGYYHFYPLPEAEYLIKAYPGSNSKYFNTYLPTYYGNTVRWTEATSLLLNDNIFNADIELIPLTELGSGAGRISGHIDYESRRKKQAEEIQMMLSNENEENVKLQYSGHDGNFVFTNLPWGTYYLYAELAGKMVIPKMIVLNEENQHVQDIQMLIKEDEIIFGLHDIPSEYLNMLSDVYPNPAGERIYVEMRYTKSGTFKLKIYDIQASCKYSKELKCKLPGFEKISVDVSDFKPGIYVLQLLTEDGYSLHRKFIVLK